MKKKYLYVKRFLCGTIIIDKYSYTKMIILDIKLKEEHLYIIVDYVRQEYSRITDVVECRSIVFRKLNDYFNIKFTQVTFIGKRQHMWGEIGSYY